jgi:hypothetical protein
MRIAEIASNNSGDVVKRSKKPWRYGTLFADCGSVEGMSELGQKRRFECTPATSAVTLKAEIRLRCKICR